MFKHGSEKVLNLGRFMARLFRESTSDCVGGGGRWMVSGVIEKN